MERTAWGAHTPAWLMCLPAPRSLNLESISHEADAALASCRSVAACALTMQTLQITNRDAARRSERWTASWRARSNGAFSQLTQNVRICGWPWGDYGYLRQIHEQQDGSWLDIGFNMI